MSLVLGGVTLTVLLLFYWGVYRPTRSSFSGWWTLALLCAASARSLLLLNGSDVQVVTNPASIVLAVIGVTCVWFATRSLRHERLPVWLLGAAPVAILAVRTLEHAAGGVWAGNRPLFVYMASMFVAATVEMWLAWRARRAIAASERSGEPVVALLVSALAGTVFAGFYAFRAATQVVVGLGRPSAQLSGFTGAESVILLVCLVAVTFSVAAVGWDQQTQELRRRAMLDDLTGLLGRTEFRLQAETALARARTGGVHAWLIVADLDRFKAINDTHGHPAGDRALIAFASLLKDALRPGECAGRQGGDEFGIVLLDVADADMRARLAALSEAYASLSSGFLFPLPSVSFGIAGIDDGDSLAEIYERADLALYRAKASGRDRAVRYSHEATRRVGRVSRPQRSTGSGPDFTGVA